MAIRGFNGGGSNDRKKTTGGKPGTSNPKNAATVSPQIKQKAAPPPSGNFYDPKAQSVLASTGTGAPTGIGGSNQGANPGGSAPNQYNGQSTAGASSGFGYTPTGLSQLYANPLPLAQDVLSGMGIDNYGMSQLLADAFNPAMYQFMINSQGMGDQSDRAVIDYITQYLTQATTPNGQMPDFGSMVDILLSSGDPNSSRLAADLSALTPEDQVQTMMQYMQAAGYGNNPLAQRAQNRAMDYFGTQYLGGTMKREPGGPSYAAFLQNSPLAGWQ